MTAPVSSARISRRLLCAKTYKRLLRRTPLPILPLSKTPAHPNPNRAGLPCPAIAFKQEQTDVKERAGDRESATLRFLLFEKSPPQLFRVFRSFRGQNVRAPQPKHFKFPIPTHLPLGWVDRKKCRCSCGIPSAVETRFAAVTFHADFKTHLPETTYSDFRDRFQMTAQTSHVIATSKPSYCESPWKFRQGGSRFHLRLPRNTSTTWQQVNRLANRIHSQARHACD